MDCLTFSRTLASYLSSLCRAVRTSKAISNAYCSLWESDAMSRYDEPLDLCLRESRSS